MLYSVITTIQQPTQQAIELKKHLDNVGGKLIVIGDRKGPQSYLEDCLFYSIEDQKKLPFEIVKLLPEGHYSRKNIGYLIAMQNKASHIYETDDDNKPDNTWTDREEYIVANCLDENNGFVNVYSFFTQNKIWARGLPLNYINKTITDNLYFLHSVSCPIQQGLVNGSPDVDAIWRLTFNSNFYFEKDSRIMLSRNTWHPFNSQSTWWWQQAYPLMYLPSYCSFRMTDIWRSFIAQRCLWELNKYVAFHGAEAFQSRNEHNLMKDFEDEVVGYLDNQKMCDRLQELDLNNNIQDSMFKCYEMFVENGWVDKKELDILSHWFKDLNAVRS